MSDLGITVMCHPEAEDVTVNPVAGDAWLEFGSEGYTRVQIYLNLGVAQAIVDALAPYATACVK